MDGCVCVLVFVRGAAAVNAVNVVALTNTVALAAGKDTVPYRLASSDCSVGCTLAAPRVLSTMKKGPKTSQRAGEKVKKRKGEKKKKRTHTK